MSDDVIKSTLHHVYSHFSNLLQTIESLTYKSDEPIRPSVCCFKDGYHFPPSKSVFLKPVFIPTLHFRLSFTLSLSNSIRVWIGISIYTVERKSFSSWKIVKYHEKSLYDQILFSKNWSIHRKATLSHQASMPCSLKPITVLLLSGRNDREALLSEKRNSNSGRRGRAATGARQAKIKFKIRSLKRA